MFSPQQLISNRYDNTNLIKTQIQTMFFTHVQTPYITQTDNTRANMCFQFTKQLLHSKQQSNHDKKEN